MQLSKKYLYNITQIRNLFKDYDPKKTGKIDEESFLLAIVNGYLKETFADPLISDTYLN